jgi:hypothetical protein
MMFPVFWRLLTVKTTISDGFPWTRGRSAAATSPATKAPGTLATPQCDNATGVSRVGHGEKVPTHPQKGGSITGDTPNWIVYSGKSYQIDDLEVPLFQESSI